MENMGSKIENPAQEISALKERLAALEGGYGEPSVEKVRPEIAREALTRHLKETRERASDAYKISPEEAHRCSLDIEEKKTEEARIDALFELARDKGITNAFEVAGGLGSPHLLDAFHDAFIKRHDEFLR
ncbi:MAG: hypothetical protein HZC14_02110 [Candidatus Niyogibacteria bacterium]|nr:hypothetical protein [Candidatus Niyogibacteria bacterium]